MATAVQVESLWNGLTDNNGQPLAAGRVYTYAAGTTTPVSLFTAADKSTSATNPLILDGYGKAQVWADGRYKFVIKTSADVTLYTLDNLLYGFDDTTVLYGGTSTGSANAHTVSVPATVTSYANGQTVSFIAGFTNTGATTLQFNSLSAVNLVKGATPSSLQAGDLTAGQLYTATYHGGAFRLTDYPTVADVQNARFETVSNVSGTNTITGTLVPAITSYDTGLHIRLKSANTTTGPATINLNSLGPKAVQYNNAALVTGEIGQNLYHNFVYDGTQFQLLNPAMSASTRTLPAQVAQVQDGDYIWLGTTSGTATAQTANASPAIAAYKNGQKFRMKPGFASSGSSPTAHTLAVNGLAATSIIHQNGVNPTLGSWFTGSGRTLELVYNDSAFYIVSNPTYYDTWTPTLTPQNGTASGTTFSIAKYQRVGHNSCNITLRVTWTQNTAAANFIDITLPLRPNITLQGLDCIITTGASLRTGFAIISSSVGSGTVRCYDYDQGAIATGTKELILSGTYEIG